MNYALFFIVTAISTTYLNADCIFDVYGKAYYDFYDAALTAQFRDASCDCLSNILANSSDTSSNCNKLICAMECTALRNTVLVILK